MKNNNETIFVFASGYRDLYKKEIYNTLAYPSEFLMHFRYRLKWVSLEISNHISLEGKNLIVIATIELDDQNKNKNQKFMPLRKGKIISTSKDGDTLHIYFELSKDWVLYEDNSNDRIDLYDTIIKRGGNPSNGVAVAFGNAHNFKFSNDDLAWVYIINRLVEFPEYQNSLFFRLNSVTRVPNNKPLELKKLDPFTNGYILKRRKNYIFDFSFNFGHEPPENAKSANFELNSDEILKIFPNKLMLGFRVDKKHFFVSPSSHSSNERTIISTKIKGTIEAPLLEIPIRVTKNKLLYGLYLFLILLGLIFISLPLAENILGVTLKLCGAISTALGTFLINYYTKY